MSENRSEGMTYAKAGVDIAKEERSIARLAKRLRFRRKGFGAPLVEIGHYAGLIDMGEYALAMTTDGVGSKVLVANAMKKWDTVGIDCIAMNVNDLLAIGAEPLAFVDYLAMEKPDESMVEQIAVGLQKGAEMSNISIVGGEMATLPDIISGFDLAGTCVGIVPKDRIITGESIQVGDLLLGLPSSGIHSNGLTLARKVIERAGYSYEDPFTSTKKSIGEELLTPTRIYMEILDLVERCEVHGLAHITGSGLLKLRRLTKHGFNFDDPLIPHPIFKFLQEEGGISDIEMYKTFNMGMGFLVVLPEKDAKSALKITGGKIVGEVVEKGIMVRDLQIV
ncbi:MAG: phosphoribosylformylglycinamidine cyclo-ligase [Methanocellales archaeon]|nr:phosphoribosylformylglycinamidine cyclo-ligase [Methanocellales archaeon]